MTVTQEEIIGLVTTSLIILTTISLIVRSKKDSWNRKQKTGALSPALPNHHFVEIFKSNIEMQEREREKIARNLHDQVNPILIVLRQNLQRHSLSLRQGILDPNEFKNDCDLIDKAIDEIRTTSYDLIPSFLIEYGLCKSLKNHIHTIENLPNLATTYFEFLQPNAPIKLTKHQELNVYRSVLELLNNILKHSKPNTLRLQISQSKNALNLKISHNGFGISNSDVQDLIKKDNGIGLKSIQARVQLLGATLNYLKEDQGGTIVLHLPMALN